MIYNYYYNTIPKEGKVRNNLVYTSLISDDQKTLVKWFHNDSEYHMGMNRVVDPNLMKEKWNRELCWLNHMSLHSPELIPKILDVDLVNRKIYLEIDGPDFWQRHYNNKCSYDQVLPDWREQMLNIIHAHKDLGLWKFSMHPSSYFIVGDQLKSINYFFCYHDSEPMISVEEHRSHISIERQAKLEKIMEANNLTWESRVPFLNLQLLCFDSFKNNYPEDFIEQAKSIFTN